MPTVSFGGMNDYQTEQDKIKQQQMLAQMMIMQSMKGQADPGSVGGIPVKQSKMAPLAQMAQALVGAYGNSAASKSQAALAQTQQADALKWMQGMQTMQGPSMVEGPTEAPGQMGPGAPVTKQPDKMQLMAALMGGMKNPQSAPIAQMMLAQAMKPQEFDTTPRYDQQGNAFVLDKQGNRKNLDGVKARDKMEIANFGGTSGAYNPFKIAPGTVIPHTPTPDSPLTAANKPFMAGGAPNTAYQQYELNRAAAGKPSVNVKVDAKMGESLAKEIGPMVEASKSGALGAIDTLDIVGRIQNAIKDNKVNLGPTATVRQTIDQLAQVSGIGGASTEERLVNTRNVMRGLAQSAVAARKGLKGQGQVSDYEGKLIQRAEAGEIQDFTVPELKDFMATTERLARKTYAVHQTNVNVMKNQPGLKQLVPFYETPELPAARQSGVRVYNPATGKIE